MGSDGGSIALEPKVNLKSQFVPQGISADLIATIGGYTREDVDSFAVESHKRAANATDKGYFKSIVPLYDQSGLHILSKDENIRSDATIEALSALKPSFEKMGELGYDAMAIRKYSEIEIINHIHTAGNSSAIVDGASVVLIGSGNKGRELGLSPKAKIISAATVSTDPTIMLTGPGPASKKALKQVGMNMNDIDIIEVNEAFASVVLRFIEDMNLNGQEKINVNGGAIAMGHPLGATGAMLLGTAIDELERRDLNTALITLCVAGGMGIATIIERA